MISFNIIAILFMSFNGIYRFIENKKSFDEILTQFRKEAEDDIKNDKNIEYYKVKRFPNASTIIYNPKTEMVYQFVEVKK